MDAETTERVDALNISTSAKYDLLEIYEEDCQEYSRETALEKLDVAIRDIEELE